MSLMKKIAAVLMSLGMCVSCSDKKDPGSREELTVTFMDVGKADSIVLTSGSGTVVIDCGEKGDGKEIISYLSDMGVDTVDYLIITHYDKDHVGGAAKVINSLDVKNVLAPDYEEESDETEKYRKALSSKDITPTLVTADISFTLGDVKYTVYAPEKDYYGEDNDNDFSLVTKAVHGDNVMLFTADAMEQRLGEIMDIGDCVLLKVPYHGRKLKNLGEFLDKVKPECAVTCTSKSEFSSDTQMKLSERNIKSYATCFNGRITAVSDGSSINIETEK